MKEWQNKTNSTQNTTAGIEINIKTNNEKKVKLETGIRKVN